MHVPQIRVDPDRGEDGGLGGNKATTKRGIGIGPVPEPFGFGEITHGVLSALRNGSPVMETEGSRIRKKQNGDLPGGMPPLARMATSEGYFAPFTRIAT